MQCILMNMRQTIHSGGNLECKNVLLFIGIMLFSIRMNLRTNYSVHCQPCGRLGSMLILRIMFLRYKYAYFHSRSFDDFTHSDSSGVCCPPENLILYTYLHMTLLSPSNISLNWVLFGFTFSTTFFFTDSTPAISAAPTMI